MLDAAGRVCGVALGDGREIRAGRVVLTTGTFLGGLIHIGDEKIPAGRVGEAPSLGLSRTLRRLGFALGRLKTGTPPRLDGTTIDWRGLDVQPGDDPPVPFSFLTERIATPQVVCHITETNPATHAVIRGNLDRSPLYAGEITGVGPRYCPRSRTRSCASPSASGTRFSSNRRVSTTTRSIRTASRPRCRAMCRARCWRRYRVSNAP